MLPALPTGMYSASSPPSSPSWISNAAVFWPSMRNSLTEFTSTIGCVSVSSRTSVSAWSKLPFSEITRAPCMSVWAILPWAILPSGTITAHVMPARAAYAAALAAVLPVDAQITALAPSRTAADDRAGHPAILERAGRVGALELQAHGRADHLREHRRAQQRRRALLQADQRVARSERQALAIALDQRHVGSRRGYALHPRDLDARLVHTNSSSITRIVLGAERTKSNSPSRSTATRRSRLEHGMRDHHQARALAHAPLHHGLDRHTVLAQHLSDRGEHARAVGDVEVQVEGVLDVLDQRQRQRRSRRSSAAGHHADDVAQHGAGGLRDRRRPGRTA